MPRSPEKHPHAEEVRLQAFLAHSGVASRRAAEEMIASGRVFVNGVSVTAPGTKVRPGVDEIQVEGQAVDVQPVTWIALHKPRGYVTSRHDQYGRKTVYDLLPDRYQGLFHVGRLDRDSEGLLLLTNDGPLANRMLHPSFGVTKEYWADVEGKPTAEELHRLTDGVEDEGDVLRAESVRRLHQTDENEHRLSVVLAEGKKREVRRMLELLGHPVRRLIRRRFGPIALGELKPGKWRVVPDAELAALRKPKKERTGDARPSREAPSDASERSAQHASAEGGEHPPRRRERTDARRPASKAGGKYRKGAGDKPRKHAPARGKAGGKAARDEESKPRRASQERASAGRPFEHKTHVHRPKHGFRARRDADERDEAPRPPRERERPADEREPRPREDASDRWPRTGRTREDDGAERRPSRPAAGPGAGPRRPKFGKAGPRRERSEDDRPSRGPRKPGARGADRGQPSPVPGPPRGRRDDDETTERGPARKSGGARGRPDSDRGGPQGRPPREDVDSAERRPPRPGSARGGARHQPRDEETPQPRRERDEDAEAPRGPRSRPPGGASRGFHPPKSGEAPRRGGKPAGRKGPRGPATRRDDGDGPKGGRPGPKGGRPGPKPGGGRGPRKGGPRGRK